MSREEAAWTYLDSLLGFQGDYGKFKRALDVLDQEDRRQLEIAASFRAPAGAGRSEVLFCTSTDNEYQNHKEG